MKNFLLACTFFFFLFLTIKFLGGDSNKAQIIQRGSRTLSLRVEESPAIQDPDRVGINLGQWTSWGAQQFLQNVLMNPGFEGTVNRILVIVSQANEKSFSDEAGWGYPDNEWNEATFFIRTGQSAGRQGTIKKSLNSGENGFPEYFSDEPLPPIEENAIIVLSKEKRSQIGPEWEPKDMATVRIDPHEHRPQSEGSQSLRLAPKPGIPGEISYYLDAISSRVEKFLPIEGKWQFSLWAKGNSSDATLTISFKRLNGENPFFQKTIPLTTEWKHYSFDFIGKDKGPPAPLTLTLTASRPNMTVWVDDIFLGQKQQVDSPFREQVITLLQQLKPSFLREFPHLADSFENRVAPPFKRKSWTSRLAGNRTEIIYGYSLQDFLNLCALVGTNPWIIVPTTFTTDAAYQKLGKFLAAAAGKDRFSEVILEFGYENWNWQYRPAGIPYSKEQGEMAAKAFKNIQLGMGGWVNARFLVNGEYTIPWIALEFLDRTSNAEGLAIAPYFFRRLERGTPDNEALALLFENDEGMLQEIADEVYQRNKFFAVYELNLHTTRGNARAYERDRMTSGAASGSALAKKILEAMFLGADPVMVFNLLQYDTITWETEESVKLWGITRDLGPPLRLRPTGLAVDMLNRVIDGDMYRILPRSSFEAENLTAAAFKAQHSWTAAVISENTTPQELTIMFPDDNHPLPTSLMTLEAATPFDTNEEEERVTISEKHLEIQDRTARITIPAWGFVVMK